MKDIKTAKFFKEFCALTSNMYRLGWDERNGGNLSYLLRDEDLEGYLDTKNVIRTIPMSFDASEIKGKMFLVTGTGKYFKNVQYDPENNLGIVRIAEDGVSCELLWGYRDGGKFTSELPAHLMSHMVRLKKDPEHRVVMHTHPTNTIAMSLILGPDEREFTRALWKMQTESIVVFPEGVGVLPWLVCGTNDIGVATAEKLQDARLCVWTTHGIYGVGKDLDEAFGLIETVEKAAQLYMLICNRPHINTIRDEELKEVAEAFGLTYRKDFLNL